MTMTEAVKQVRNGMIDGVRGPGCAAIVMADGRRFSVTSEGYSDALMVQRFSADGELLERCKANEVEGDAERVEWTTDELGGIYIR